MLSVDIIPDELVNDDAGISRQLAEEIQPLVPGVNVFVVVDHNYSE